MRAAKALARRWIYIAATLVFIGTVQAEEAPMAQVVFVCEHGSVKSVMASEWFNLRARERRVAIRAVSRGVTPDDAIPPRVAENLRQDGFAVAGFKPKRLEKADLAAAVRVVAIGVESPLFRETTVPVEEWNEVPAASTEYERSRDAIRGRVEALLQKLSEGAASRNHR
jgi:protein-tyrosine-phosphatase